MYAGVPIIAPVRVSCTSNIVVAAACACASAAVAVWPSTMVSGTLTLTSETTLRSDSCGVVRSPWPDFSPAPWPDFSLTPCPDRSLAPCPDFSVTPWPDVSLAPWPDFSLTPDLSPFAVLSAAVIWRASPKSMTRTWLSRPTMTLSGLKSRWTSPSSCAAASPRPAAMNTFRISCQLRAAACSQ